MTKPVNVVKIIDLLLSHFSRGRLCDPIDGSPPGSPVPGILQARILERVAISFSNACIHAKSLQFSSVQSLSRVRLCDAMNRLALQASLSITNSWSSLRLTSIESVMPSTYLILCRPLLLLPLITPSIRVFSNESTLSMRWPKYWSFNFSIIPSNFCVTEFY